MNWIDSGEAITRRRLLLALTASAAAQTPVVVPVRQLVDGTCTPSQLEGFERSIWPEAVRDFRRAGIHLQVSPDRADIRRTPSGKPVFTQLERSAINLVLTDHVPMEWDEGRGMAGVTTVYEGRHLCLIALRYAHAHLIPFIALNTCVHEILHVLMHDVYEKRPRGIAGQQRELRIDAYATRLWLLGEGAVIRDGARAYVERLRREKIEISRHEQG